MHGSWCWQRVARSLAGLGHHVVAVDLPGRADRVNLADHVAVVVSAIDAGPSAVLVAHSLGGVVCSQAAEQRFDSVRGIVFVAAAVPADGESAMEVLQGAQDSHLLKPGVLAISADNVRIAPGCARHVFFNRCSDSDAAWAERQLRPEPTRPLLEPVSLTTRGFGSVPKHYIVTTDDKCFPTATQRFLAERCGATWEEIDSDHSPFLSVAEELSTRMVSTNILSV
jgi:pimeloyl-ACP methyl ester carboxylesterase